MGVDTIFYWVEGEMAADFDLATTGRGGERQNPNFIADLKRDIETVRDGQRF